MWNDKVTQVHWEPTDKCNSGCAMCPRYDSQGFELSTLENVEWTLESFKKAWTVDFIKDLNKVLACGNFGDPCACKEFVDMYEYMREINPNIELACNTNGSLRTQDWWARLGKVITQRPNRTGGYCTFSIDGLEDTNHLYRRGTIWKNIMRNAEAFIAAGGEAHWDFIVFEHNEHQVDEARELAIKMGFKNFNVKRTTRWNQYKDGQGAYPVIWKGKYLYDLKQPKEEKFKHNFEDATYFQQSKYQSFNFHDFQQVEGKINKDSRFVNGKYQSIVLHELKIACRAIKNAREYQPANEIFISAGGHVAPCCFLGSEPFKDYNGVHADKNYVDLINMQGGLTELNMHKNNIYDILQLDIFQKWIPDTWKEDGNRSMRPMKCGQCCGVEFNNLDYGELGDKKDSYLE
jgi:MoaA/NifB/PqqE/SkfB family radical SAM enzyme